MKIQIWPNIHFIHGIPSTLIHSLIIIYNKVQCFVYDLTEIRLLFTDTNGTESDNGPLSRLTAPYLKTFHLYRYISCTGEGSSYSE